MKNCNALSSQTTRRILPIACATALAVAFTVSLPQPAHAGQVTAPDVPTNIAVPEGNHAFLVGHAVGTQNYVCVPSAASTSGVAYALFTPEATLFSDDLKQVTTHFFSPNPSEANTNPAVVADGTIRATWQHSRDTSSVWGKVRPADPGVPGDLGDSSTDPAFVKPGAVAWVKVTVTGTEDGPTGGDTLSKTTFVQRLNTVGGVAPSTGCASPSNLGNQAFVPYTADYFFYTNQ
jgi:Protein of unknown function (DUF3455)